MNKKKDITPADFTRCDRYHYEFNRFIMRFYAKDDANKQVRLDFIEKHKEKYPKLSVPNLHFRLAVRKYFDDNVYSLREHKFKREPIPEARHSF